LNVERVLALDDRSFYVQGSTSDEDTELVRLTAISPEGGRAELHEKLFRSETHFICFFEAPSPSALPTGWVFETEDAGGLVAQASAPPVLRDLETVRDLILADTLRARDSRGPNEKLMNGHIHPAIQRIQDRVRDAVEVESVTQYGSGPDSADVSIVVPVYKRIDHVEMQIAAFSEDPAIRDADLVYVLDTPEDAGSLRESAAALAEIYDVPFRVAVLAQNVGFAGASNAGVSLARARLLLLMNSDVLPDRPGWLETMRAFYDEQPNIGALGPKLLYEDDSIQHAGMYYYRESPSSPWQDGHFFKGLHRSLPAANVARPVPAVSGSCLMIERELYGRFGLRGIYVRGDCEDFDLCLCLADAGYESWYLPEAELYHLEAQSYFGELRDSADRYNSWLHWRLWRNRIEELASDGADQDSS
jgi:GT2 family glycosyltransferase